ncbi:MAG: hypothetical protein J6N18_04515, partial [Kiritimatiellae bacterium]|nr:hypothetical protein [Kiritimatiellia bacterium]
MVKISKDTLLIGRNMTYLCIRLVASSAASMLAVRIVLKALSAEHYGAYAAVLAVVAVAGTFNGMLENAARRFLSHEMSLSSDGNVSRVFSALFILVGGVALLAVMIGETVGLWFVRNALSIPEGMTEVVETVFHSCLAANVLGLLQVPFTSQITSGERMFFFAKLGFLEAALCIASSYVAYAGLAAYAFAVMTSAVLELVVCVVFCFRLFPQLRFTFDAWRESVSAIGAFVSWGTLGTVGNLLKYQGSGILLNVFAGVAFSTSWKIALGVWGLLWNVCGNFRQAFCPTVFKAWEGRSADEFLKITGRTTAVSFLIAAVPAVFIFIWTEHFLELWLGGQTAPYLVAFVRCSLVNLVFDAVSSPLTAAIDAT